MQDCKFVRVQANFGLQGCKIGSVSGCMFASLLGLQDCKFVRVQANFGLQGCKIESVSGFKIASLLDLQQFKSVRVVSFLVVARLQGVRVSRLQVC